MSAARVGWVCVAITIVLTLAALLRLAAWIAYRPALCFDDSIGPSPVRRCAAARDLAGQRKCRDGV